MNFIVTSVSGHTMLLTMDVLKSFYKAKNTEDVERPFYLDIYLNIYFPTGLGGEARILFKVCFLNSAHTDDWVCSSPSASW